jgi:hypothetical protein
MAIDTARLQTDQSYRDQVRDQGYFVGSEGGQVYAQLGGNPATGGGGSIISPSNPTGAQPTVAGQSSQQLASGINSLLGAIASGNKQAFDEAVRQFNATFGLDKDKFNEAIRQFNQNYLISEAGLTGTYQGQQTQQAQLQAANIAAQQAALSGYYQQPGLQGQATGNLALDAFNTKAGPGDQQAYLNATGGDRNAAAARYWNDVQGAIQQAGMTPQQFVYGATGQPSQGVPTMAREQQTYAQQMGVATLASQLQANPFRQQQVLGQASRILGGQPVAGFQAPGVVAGVGTAGGNQQGGLGYLQQMIDDIKNPVPNQTTADQFLQQTPTPNKIDSTSFLRAAPSTQNILLQAMQEKYGIDPNDALTQIKNTLPQFQAPTTTFGTIKR